MADRSPLIAPRSGNGSGRGLTRTTSIRGAARFLSRAGGWRMTWEPSVQVRETAVDQLELRQDDWYFYKPVVGANIAWNALSVVAAAAVMVTSRAERPVLPLRLWVSGHVMQCLVHVVLVCVEYWRRVRGRSGAIVGGGGWALVPPSLPFFMGADDGTMSQGDEVIGVVKSANTIFSFIWWIIGFYWISTTGDALKRDAPQLYWCCFVFLSLDILFFITSVALNCVIALAVCFCLPFVLRILSHFSDQSEGVSNEHIHQLKKYKFERDGKPGKNRGELPRQFGGKMVECGNKKSFHYLSPEDAMCCICLSPYENGDELRELPCTPIGHHFHLKCIDRWLVNNTSCPQCRKSVMPNNHVSEV